MRSLQYSVVRIVLAAVPIVAFNVAFGMLGIPGPPGMLLQAAGTLAIYAGYVRWVERRSVAGPVLRATGGEAEAPRELAGEGAVAELARGFLLGAALFTTTIGILCVLGVASVERAGDWSGAGYALAGAVAAAVTEEILMRAIFFRLVERSLGTWIALGLSAALFGILHAFNPGATLVSTLAIALEAGVLLAAAFVWTRRLWLVFGLHAAWNFTEGGVFGASVSGGKAHGLLASHFDGPSLLTGGAFGPEASLVAVVVCLAAGIGLLVLGHRHGRFIAPRWRAQPAPRAA